MKKSYVNVLAIICVSLFALAACGGGSGLKETAQYRSIRDGLTDSHFKLVDTKTNQDGSRVETYKSDSAETVLYIDSRGYVTKGETRYPLGGMLELLTKHLIKNKYTKKEINLPDGGKQLVFTKRFPANGIRRHVVTMTVNQNGDGTVEDLNIFEIPLGE